MSSVCCEGEDVGGSAEAAVTGGSKGEKLVRAKKALGNKGLSECKTGDRRRVCTE
jgi:hypothetical protein